MTSCVAVFGRTVRVSLFAPVHIPSSIRATMVLPAAGDICQLAKRAPKAVRTGDAATDANAESERQALIGVIQHLHQFPALSMPTSLALTFGTIKVEAKRDEMWPEC